MTDRMKEVATLENIQIHHVGRTVRKESFVSDLLKERSEHDGVVCILSAMEGCSCFKVRKNHQTGYLELHWSKGKCLNYYVYIMDPDYGLCYLRIPTWAPFRLQFSSKSKIPLSVNSPGSCRTGFRSGFHVSNGWNPYAFLKQRVALCPPKPSELLRATLMSCWRASFGT